MSNLVKFLRWWLDAVLKRDAEESSWLTEAASAFKALAWNLVATSLAFGVFWEFWKFLSAYFLSDGNVTYLTVVSASSWTQVVSSAIVVIPFSIIVSLVLLPWSWSISRNKQEISGWLPIYVGKSSQWKDSIYAWITMVVASFLIVVCMAYIWSRPFQEVLIKDFVKSWTWFSAVSELTDGSWYYLAYRGEYDSVLYWKWTQDSPWFLWKVLTVPSSSVLVVTKKEARSACIYWFKNVSAFLWKGTWLLE